MVQESRNAKGAFEVGLHSRQYGSQIPGLCVLPAHVIKQHARVVGRRSAFGISCPFCGRVRLNLCCVGNDAVVHANETAGIDRLIVVGNAGRAVSYEAAVVDARKRPGGALCAERVVQDLVEAGKFDELERVDGSLKNPVLLIGIRDKPGRIPASLRGQPVKPGQVLLEEFKVKLRAVLDSKPKDAAHLPTIPLILGNEKVGWI